MTGPATAAHDADATRAAPGRVSPALEAVRARRSWSKVTDEAPTRAQLLTLVSAAGRVADHSSLEPWRLIELRGADRERLGRAINKANGEKGSSSKPLRAPLLIAVVASYRKSDKVPRWEQEAVAAGVAHTLSLLLDEAGWGVIWRTGHYTRSKAVATLHGLGKREELLGWLYVGGKPANARIGRRKAVDARRHLSRLPAPDPAKGKRAAEPAKGKAAPDPAKGKAAAPAKGKTAAPAKGKRAAEPAKGKRAAEPAKGKAAETAEQG